MTADAQETIVLVTGANKGIGREIALSLARGHGYTVIVGSRQLAAGEEVVSKLKSEGFKASSVQLDLTSDESIANAASTIEKQYGRLDVLINNAGIFLDQVTPEVPKLPTRELYDRTFATNVVGPACLTEAALPLLKKARGQARVVFVSSSMGSLQLSTDKTMPWHNLNCTSYDASKAAMNMVALNYARTLEDIGARVNIACPGLVRTDLTSQNPDLPGPEEGAEYIVKLATTEKDGPTGTFGSKNGPVPW